MEGPEWSNSKTEGQRLIVRGLWPKEKQKKGKVPGEFELGSPSLFLPEKSLHNSHFSHTILSRRYPQLQYKQQLEDTNTTARKELLFRVTKTHFRPHRPSPRLSCTWKAAGGINAREKAGLPSWSAPALLRLAVRPWVSAPQAAPARGSGQ